MRPARSGSEPTEPLGQRNALSLFGFAIRVAGALIWIAAGATKLPDLAAFATQVERYEILPHLLVVPLAYILPFFEILLGVYLAAGLFVRASALVGTLLFVIFLTAQVQALIRGLKLDCGCFGTLAKSTVGPWTLLRDTALGIPTFVMLAFPSRQFSLDRRLFGAVDSFSRNS